MSLWEHPLTPPAYQRFERQWGRYAAMNRALAASLALEAGHTVLDVGAGTGETARALLGEAPVAITAVEPSDAMWQSAGLDLARARQLADVGEARFDRVVAGACAWLLGPLPQALEPLVARVAPGGALSFAIPAAYVGAPDPPGEGPDPWLTALAAALVAGRTRTPEEIAPLPDAETLTAWLGTCGRVDRWEVTWRWHSEALRDWFAVPPIGCAMRPDLPPEDLAAAVDRAWQAADRDSWRDERWLGWTLWT